MAAGSRIAFAVVERLHVFAKTSGQASIWTYAIEPATLEATHSGDKANHVTAYGPTSLADYGDAWDFADAGDVGEERFVLAVEPQIVDVATGNLRASLGMAREQRFALAVKAMLQPNPALELLDAVTFDDVTAT